jgi:hypothetical protein
LRQDRLAVDKEVKAMKANETFVQEHIINNVPKGDSGAVGKLFKGIVYTDVVYQVDDWEAFYKHLQKTGEFDLLNRALNQAAVKERVDSQVRPTGKRGEKAMSEAAIQAARMAQRAADDMKQAALNMDGTLESFRMLWERQIMPDLQGFMERLEVLAKESK